MSAETRQKDQTIEHLTEQTSRLQLENCQLKDEVCALKGRGQNLAREIELHCNEMHKLNSGNTAAAEHNKILQERVKVLEQDCEYLRTGRNEAQQQAHAAKQATEILEKELIVYRTKSLKAEGDSHSSGATIQRL